MTPLVDTIMNVMASSRGGRPVCLVCGRAISSADESMRLRADSIVHRRCATYDARRRRRGDARR